MTAPLAGSNPKMTDMRTEQPFTSFVPEGMYNVGSTLKLPRNGRLTFNGATGATTTIKFVGDANGEAAEEGGRESRRRDGGGQRKEGGNKTGRKKRKSKTRMNRALSNGKSAARATGLAGTVPQREGSGVRGSDAKERKKGRENGHVKQKRKQNDE